ncbi:retinaldehyde-binding protein 1-like [Phlebotomus argentipes]|uniref:retinaldehyde-binding protein 1-like n=1 Tax=Phlebotomus argentipes TaxID=94469 RepID=UPI002892ED4E|nr:retinaldehyde-binding protein 1-like [Phlebotomus argentipes]
MMIQSQRTRKNSVFLTDLEEYPIFTKGDFTLKVDVRYLSEKSKKKAEEELNETEEVKTKALERMSELIKGEEDLDIPYDNRPFMVKFLRARKFDVDEAFTLMKNYFKFKSEFPELFKDVVPSKVAYILAMNAAFMSPVKDQHGHTVLMGRAELFDPDIATPMEFIAAGFVIGEGIMMEPESQVNGFVGVIDCKGFSYKHFKKITISLIKLGLRLAQSVVPVIPRRVHLINQNFYVNALYKIVKPFLPQEYIDMIYFHGENIEELYEYIPKECLLEHFGGTIKDPEITEEEYRDYLKGFDEEYLALNALGYRNYNF